jgi:glutaredoxin 3
MIKIITKDYCPYCVLAKELISSLWFEYEEIDVTNDGEKLMEVVNISWMRTVPQIFAWEIKTENLLWWYSDIKALNDEGILEDRLK